MQAEQARGGAPSDEDDEARRMRRCLALCRVGELSRAARVLDPAHMAPDSEATLQVLRDLHPEAPSVLPDWLPDFHPDDAFQLDPDAVRRALEGASRLLAGGLSGMIYELYRDILLEHPATFLPFFAVCSHMARGEVPPRAQAALSSCRLLALAKAVPDGPDGVRPIAIAEVFQRLVSRSIALQMRDAFQQFFSPLQFAVSTPGGCESIIAGIRALLDADPELLVMQVDLANAFNEVDRTAIFEELRAHFPALIPFTLTTDVDTGGLPFQAALRAARDVLPASARQLLPPFHQLGLQAVPDVQERLMRAIEMERAEALRESLGDSAGRARLLSQTAPGAGAFLTAVPLMQSLRFTHECFRTALRTRLGLLHPAIAGVRRCECGEELQEGVLAGQHLMRCGRGGERTLTHDGIRDVVFVILREAGLSVRREARGIFPLRGDETEGRVMDLVAANPRGGPRLLVDVTVADPLQAPVTAAAVERGHAARAAEAVKTAKYSDHSPDDSLIPAAIETFGCLGGQFDSLLCMCAQRAAALRVGDES
ncbi:hypothetical protein KFL_017180010, partial [Klebsormidium nitens]